MIQHISHLTSEKNKKTKYNTIQYYSLKCKYCLERESCLGGGLRS